jgi:hypothetical protein
VLVVDVVLGTDDVDDEVDEVDVATEISTHFQS